jgi:hypothetical protein
MKKVSNYKEIHIMKKRKITFSFDKSFLTLSPRLIMAFLKLEEPDKFDDDIAREKWFVTQFSQEVRKELKLKSREGKKDVENYIRKLIVYKQYLYDKFKK